MIVNASGSTRARAMRGSVWPFIDCGIVAIAIAEGRARWMLDIIKVLHAARTQLVAGVCPVRDWMLREGFSPQFGGMLALPATWRGELPEPKRPPYVIFDRRVNFPVLLRPGGPVHDVSAYT